MAKKIKPIVEESTEETVTAGAMLADLNIEATEIEMPKSEAIEKELVKDNKTEGMPKIYIPDVPAQMIEEKKKGTSVPEEPKVETEIEFLQRILFIQEDGGFGMHLHKLINNRIKLLS